MSSHVLPVVEALRAKGAKPQLVIVVTPILIVQMVRTVMTQAANIMLVQHTQQVTTALYIIIVQETVRHGKVHDQLTVVV